MMMMMMIVVAAAVILHRLRMAAEHCTGLYCVIASIYLLLCGSFGARLVDGADKKRMPCRRWQKAKELDGSSFLLPR